jgi:hypothetical protein
MASDNTRVYKASDVSKAGLQLSEDSVSLVGNQQNAIIVNSQGVFIKGKISLVPTGEQIRQAGLFVKVPDFLSMIPSTMVTPIADQIPMPPIQGLVGLAKDCAFFLSMLV